MIKRRETHTVKVGNVKIGSIAPVVVQSMTDTDTIDIDSTFRQFKLLADAGSEIVRVTVNNSDAARAVAELREHLRDTGYTQPIVGDFHFIGHRLLKEVPSCARALDKFRINPGNVGRGIRHDDNFRSFIETAIEYDKPVRIGVNAGSLDPDLLARRMDENNRRSSPHSAEQVGNTALVESALSSAEQAEQIGLAADKIVISCKVSRLSQMVTVYRALAEQCMYPLHLGLTEAGMGRKAVASTSAALAILLYQGIGDTIRASLTPKIGGNRSEEVMTCQDILQALGIRRFRPTVTACPGCGRTTSTLFRELAQTIQTRLDEKLPEWHASFPGSEALQVAVMGCVVNGPGESRVADIGISLPGSGESPNSPVYVDGQRVAMLSGPETASEFINMINKYVENRWGN